jgi:DNA (cytosine-5)-methyltransferase 1
VISPHGLSCQSPNRSMTLPTHFDEGNEFTSLELFTGAGGLALGVAEAGFRHLAVVEYNRDACASLRENANRISAMSGWNVHEGDARKFPFAEYADEVDLIAAGAPCQPFSLGGKHRGQADDRNLFPVVFDAVRRIRPRAVVIENVKGLLRTTFADYLEYIELQLRFPHNAPAPNEDWRDHMTRLRAPDLALVAAEDRYVVDHALLNAADFGVPQRRERVFIIAFRGDLDVNWREEVGRRLAPRFSHDALLHAKWVSGEYWKEHRVPKNRIPTMPDRVSGRVEALRLLGPGTLPRWRTVRDALRSRDPEAKWPALPEPADKREDPRFANHVANPGARSYKGHTGSEWDEPAKTLKAGDHGVPGGENMLCREDGTVRYFTVREAARLQGFPDEYIFRGAWSEGFRQLGNAVPVGLATAVAGAVAEILMEKSTLIDVR